MKLCAIIILVILGINIINSIKENFVQILNHNDLEDNYFKYIRGAKVFPIFSKTFIDKVNDNDTSDLDIDMLDLFMLVKEINSLSGFDIKKATELVTPYKLNGSKYNWGIFTTLEIPEAMKELEKHKNQLNLVQLNSVILYNTSDDIRKDIRDIVRNKYSQLINCNKLAKLFIDTELSNKNIKLDFGDELGSKELDLQNYSDDELKVIKDLLDWLPPDPCVIIEAIIETREMITTKTKLLNSCTGKLKKYVGDLYKHKKLSLYDDFKKYTKYELDIIKDIYKYLLTCNNLDKTETENKQNYFKNLLDNIDSKKENLDQLKTCPIELKKYLYLRYNKKSIPNHNLDDFPNDKIDNFSEHHLELMDELYDDIPKCDNLKKEKIIDKLLEINNYLDLIGGHSYGCKEDIQKYKFNEFKKNGISTDIIPDNDINVYRKFSFNNLVKMVTIYENIPPCKDIDNTGVTNFHKKMTRYYKNLKKDKGHEGKLFNSGSYNNRTNITADYHPYKTNNDKLPDDDFFNFTEILKESEMNYDKYFQDDLFKKPKCSKELEDYKNKNKNNKNTNNCKIYDDSIRQKYSKGIASIYAPKLIINVPKNKGIKYRVSSNE